MHTPIVSFSSRRWRSYRKWSVAPDMMSDGSMADETQSSKGIPISPPWGSVPGVALAFDTYSNGRRSLVFVGPGLVDLVGQRAAEEISRDVGRFFDLIHPEERAGI